MFLLALVYLIILIVLAIFRDWTNRGQSAAEMVLFAIIGFCLFWDVLNK